MAHVQLHTVPVSDWPWCIWRHETQWSSLFVDTLRHN